MAKRILGLGQTAQKVLLTIYRAGFPGWTGRVPALRMPFLGEVDKLLMRGLVRTRRDRLQLTVAGRSAVVRIAPLHFPLLALVCILMCLGCGDEFVGVEPGTDPRVIVLVYGLYEPPPPEDVCVEQPRPTRHEPDAGRSK